MKSITKIVTLISLLYISGCTATYVDHYNERKDNVREFINDNDFIYCIVLSIDEDGKIKVRPNIKLDD